MLSKKTALVLVMMLLIGCLPALAQADKAKPGMDMGGAQTAPASGKLSKVETKRVCMVTNKAFKQDQIAVDVDGKTYYGCCEMCKGRLTSEADLRTAVDPVSKKPVDKAAAVIAADASGKVFYFENDANLDAYNAKVAK